MIDVASALPYEFDSRKLKMATRIGGKYRLEEVYSRHWVKFAKELRLSPAEVLDMGETMAERLPAAFAGTVDEARANGLDHPILQRLVEALNARSQHCARVLEAV